MTGRKAFRVAEDNSQTCVSRFDAHKQSLMRLEVLGWEVAIGERLPSLFGTGGSLIREVFPCVQL